MSKKQIVNIINFIRDVEPRCYVDLVEPVRHQIELMQQYNLKGTFLLQYDALIDNVYTDMLKSLDPEQFELGVWFEIVQPQCEAVGIPWTGRFPWDWHVHCGFSVGYTKKQREMLADVLFEKFREIFGKYPRVFGSWFFDTHTVRYITEKYGLDAMCNCKEQYGTDGYTLWGGYYGQGYYPSKTNVFIPARTSEEQISVPLFRMLGSDHVYQYDRGVNVSDNEHLVQGVITLEPVYQNEGGGGDPAWVDWYMRENFNGECLSFGYAQAGQENSMSWKSMGKGIEYQFPLFAKLAAEGKISVEKLGDTGKWYKKTYTHTPSSAITAHNAYDDDNKTSVWYCSDLYRINLYSDSNSFRIRDIHIFDEKMPDPFEDTVCTANDAAYETLPLVDGNRHSGSGVLAGVRILRDGKELLSDKMEFSDIGNDSAKVSYGNFDFLLEKDGFSVTSESDFSMAYLFGRKGKEIPEVLSFSERELSLRYLDRKYKIRLDSGVFASPTEVRSENGKISVSFVC
ncbi:MAG: hypothetical protein IJL30_01585 [Clostridia bacterium]|nr:hypothetical protein [Clostridia bacterium]